MDIITGRAPSSHEPTYNTRSSRVPTYSQSPVVLVRHVICEIYFKAAQFHNLLHTKSLPPPFLLASHIVQTAATHTPPLLNRSVRTNEHGEIEARTAGHGHQPPSPGPPNHRDQALQGRCGPLGIQGGDGGDTPTPSDDPGASGFDREDIRSGTPSTIPYRQSYLVFE